ncbi:MAG: ATP-binding protein [Woeseiaceae bacterium]
MRLGIKSKLIFSLMLANTSLAGYMYWHTSQSFARGFLQYVNQVELKKLQPLLDDLSENYRNKNGWQWIESEHYLWRDLMNKHVRGRPLRFSQMNHKNKRFKHELHRPPHIGFRQFQNRSHEYNITRLNIDPRLLLQGKQTELIIGNPTNISNALWLPIKVDNEVVGQLGVIMLNNLSSELDVLFAKHQKENFIYMASIFLIVAVLLAFLLAAYFLGPIRLIKQGVQKLVSGHFEQKINIKRSDELGQLARDFNLLTCTLNKNQKSRQQWIADISHELRTPVTILQAELDSLIDGVREVNRDALISLQQECSRLGSLINDLHELSLSDLGALSYNKEQLDLVLLLEDFIDTHDQRIENSNIIVTLDLPDKNCMVFADGDRLEQCLNNLLQNTLRYTDSPGALCIRLIKNKHQVSLFWEDSSPGVSDEDLSFLFDRLYRVEKSRNRVKGGSGLGLSICKNIIEAHNANVKLIHSELGGLGVIITFNLEY